LDEDYRLRNDCLLAPLAWATGAGDGGGTFRHATLRAIAAQRAALHHLRARGEIGEEAFHRIQEELDWSELDAAPAGSFQSLAS
jgi:hypothetical protein